MSKTWRGAQYFGSIFRMRLSMLQEIFCSAIEDKSVFSF